MSFHWTRPPSQAFRPGVKAYVQSIRQGIISVLDLYAAKMTTDMRGNAPWTDRTANARQTLEAFVFQDEKQIVLVAKQQMWYGKYLELKNGGRYAIVMPTLQQYYSQVWRDVHEVVR